MIFLIKHMWRLVVKTDLHRLTYSFPWYSSAAYLGVGTTLWQFSLHLSIFQLWPADLSKYYQWNGSFLLHERALWIKVLYICVSDKQDRNTSQRFPTLGEILHYELSQKWGGKCWACMKPLRHNYTMGLFFFFFFLQRSHFHSGL